MRRIVYENSLSLVFLGLFILALVGQSLTGHRQYNEERQEHGQPSLPYSQYLQTGRFWEAISENWESEFLQMGVYVLLTAFLRQKGSPESKKLEGEEAVDRDPRHVAPHPDAPWPIRRGGIVLTLYAHSLTLVLLLLFGVCLVLHAVSGVREYNAEQLAHGGAPASALGYMGTATFWFESLQNWQSEFLSLAVMIVLAIFLRQRGSPESKPVDHPHRETGRE
jgi:Domain of unknown function (DUF6766)